VFLLRRATRARPAAERASKAIPPGISVRLTPVPAFAPSPVSIKLPATACVTGLRTGSVWLGEGAALGIVPTVIAAMSVLVNGRHSSGRTESETSQASPVSVAVAVFVNEPTAPAIEVHVTV